MPSRRFLWLHNGATQLARFPIFARLCLRFAHAFTRGIARRDQGVSWSNSQFIIGGLFGETLVVVASVHFYCVEPGFWLADSPP